MNKIKLESGAMLEIALLDFKTGLDLFSKISEELLKINIDLGDLNLNDLMNSNIDNKLINTLKNIVLSLISSKSLRTELENAFSRCTYNNQKITDDTFENINARKDYFIVCWEVLKYNITPFLPKTGSLSLGGLGEKITKNQK